MAASLTLGISLAIPKTSEIFPLRAGHGANSGVSFLGVGRLCHPAWGGFFSIRTNKEIRNSWHFECDAIETCPKTPVISAPEQTYLSTCPVCQNQIDVTALEPFTKLKCPFCGQMVRVRRKFDHFIIQRQIGEGGMSRVFEAEDETLGRRVALKILNPQYGRDAARVEQFRQEALITANVNHPNVIKLYSVGYDQGYFYIAMELVTGGSLEQRIRKEGSIKEEESLRIGREVAEGLRAAQQQGLIHRDVKPANILFTETGTAKVVDFGLALFVERGPDASGEIWATPYYVAPEKVIENREDYRSDIFSLGASLYHALTGRPPHKVDSNDIAELRRVKCRRVVLEDSGVRFAPRTAHVVNRMLAFRPQERCANYDETVEELRLAEGLVGQSGYRLRFATRRARWLAVAAAVLALAFGIGWFARSTGERTAVAITDSGDDIERDLTGGGVTLQAGRKTLAERFLQAREMMVRELRFAEAGHQFEQIIKSGEARQPTLNWARYNAALCAIVLGKREEAARHMADMAGDTGEGGSLVTAELAAFFKTLGGRLAGLNGGAEDSGSADYGTAPEAVLGRLIEGLAGWHLGDPQTGMEDLRRFSTILKESLTLPEWVPLYAGLLKPYEHDMRLLASVDKLKEPASEDEAKEALDLLRETRAKLQTRGRWDEVLEERAKEFRQDLARLRMERQRREMAEAAVLRQKELAQLAEITAALPSLSQGYDFERVTSLLKDIQFQSPEVQAALEGKLYLYEQARAFLEQWFADVAEKGWQGRFQRLSGAPLEGRVTEASLRQVTISLERGVVTLPLDTLSPETLLDSAQSFAAQVTDSTDYYTRQERIAVFARVAGLHSLSATVAAQLMEEHRGFRQRWMKVAQ